MSGFREKSTLSTLRPSFWQRVRVESLTIRVSICSLRRRFEQNQTDCTFTVLALLPTATENILEALPVEDLTHELQQKKAARLAKLSSGEAPGSEMSSTAPSLPEEDGRSLSSFQSDGYVHTSQLATSSTTDGQKPRSKTQLWNELKINCRLD